MKYYRVKIQGIFDTKEEVLSYATGEHVPFHEEYFKKIGNGEIIKNTPIFDYFFLKGYGLKNEWEWRLQDVHIGGWEYPRGADWYISDDFKILLENFKIAPKYHFYETRLLYKGKKLKYWIFQFPINPFQNYDYEKSEYYVDNKRIFGLKTAEEYLDYDYKIWKENKKSIEWKNTVLTDIFDLTKTMQEDTVVSERLKTAIEAMGLEGFLFSELDYEVVVEN